MNRISISMLRFVFTLLIGAFIPSGASEASEGLKVVENEKVCMVTDMYFGKTQIPVDHAGKTYYGCCANCKETLSKDAKARTAIDPVSGKPVDKAKAVIAAQADNSVVYFENQKNFEEYAKAIVSLKSNKKAGQSGGHSHH